MLVALLPLCIVCPQVHYPLCVPYATAAAAGAAVADAADAAGGA